MEDPFTLLEHTADVGLRATGATLEELFVNAARGMFAVLCEPDAVEPRERVGVSTQEADPAYLLHDWLSELLCLADARHMLFGRFEVALGDGRLDGAAWGETYDPSRHEMKAEIKAVTCHGLEVRREGDRWTAQVLFDL